jgi:hypothetical protein
VSDRADDHRDSDFISTLFAKKRDLHLKSRLERETLESKQRKDPRADIKRRRRRNSREEGLQAT